MSPARNASPAALQQENTVYSVATLQQNYNVYFFEALQPEDNNNYKNSILRNWKIIIIMINKYLAARGTATGFLLFN